MAYLARLFLVAFVVILVSPLQIQADDIYDALVKEAGKAAADKHLAAKNEMVAAEKKLLDAERPARQSWEAAQKKLQEAQDAANAAKQALRTSTAAYDQLYDKQKSMIANTKSTLADTNIPDEVKTSIRAAIEDMVAKKNDAAAAYVKARDASTAANLAVAAAAKEKEKANVPLEAATKAIEKFYNTRPRPNGYDEQATQARATAEKAEAGKYKNLEQQLMVANLNQDLANVKTDIQDIEIKKMGLENVLNKSAYGTFMKQKLEGLLMDEGFCTGVKQNCLDGSNKKRVPLDRLFSSVESQRNKKEAEAESNTH